MSFFKKIKQIGNGIHQHPLARKHKLLAYSKLLKWQIWQAFSPGIKKISFIEDISFFAKKGMTGITGNIYCGLHEFKDMGFLLHFLRENDLFIDVGANVGSYTLLATGVSKARSISFEPVPATFDHLMKNVFLNNLESRTTLLNAGVGSKHGIVNFTSDLDTVNHVVREGVHASGNTIAVAIQKVDDHLCQIQQNVSLIKIDAEGFETEVLAGMSNILQESNLKAIIIELNGSGERYGYDENKIKELLHSKGFAAHDYDPFSRLLQPLKTAGHFNTIYLRDISFVKQRVISAKKINVFGEHI